MNIQLKRIYEPAAKSDGTRILVERLWPRGVSKDKAQIDHWAKEAAPSPDLRKWFDHDPQKWPEFQSRYFAQLDENPEVVDTLRSYLGTGGTGGAGPVTFVFASREERYNNAVALREYLQSRK